LTISLAAVIGLTVYILIPQPPVVETQIQIIKSEKSVAQEKSNQNNNIVSNKTTKTKKLNDSGKVVEETEIVEKNEDKSIINTETKIVKEIVTEEKIVQVSKPSVKQNSLEVVCNFPGLLPTYKCESISTNLSQRLLNSNFSIVVTSTIPLLSPKETNLGLGIRYDF
jgi:hypothetical protein